MKRRRRVDQRVPAQRLPAQRHPGLMSVDEPLELSRKRIRRSTLAAQPTGTATGRIFAGGAIRRAPMRGGRPRRSACLTTVHTRIYSLGDEDGETGRPAVLAAAVALLLVAGCDAAAVDETRGCQEQRQADEAKLRVSRWGPPEDPPHVGEYSEVHWQARALGDPCSRVSGPTDWEYQGVIALRPQDATGWPSSSRSFRSHPSTRLSWDTHTRPRSATDLVPFLRPTPLAAQ